MFLLDNSSQYRLAEPRSLERVWHDQLGDFQERGFSANYGWTRDVDIQGARKSFKCVGVQIPGGEESRKRPLAGGHICDNKPLCRSRVAHRQWVTLPDGPWATR